MFFGMSQLFLLILFALVLPAPISLDAVSFRTVVEPLVVYIEALNLLAMGVILLPSLFLLSSGDRRKYNL